MLTKEALLALLSAAIRDEKCTLPQETDWNDLLYECQAHSVLAMAFYALDRTTVPDEIFKRWKTSVIQNISMNIRCKSAHEKITKLLQDNEIPSTTLKGVASAQYYPKEETRTLGDVDFIVASNDINRTHELLVSDGFSFDTSDRNHDWSYFKDGIHYELHFALPWLPEKLRGEESIKDIILSSRMKGKTRVPSTFYHGLIILMHMASHMFSEGVGLRHLCDWAVFVNAISNDEFVSLFKKTLEDSGILRFAQIMTLTCIKNLGIDDKEWAALSVDDWVIDQTIEEIFQKGNFGSKAESDLSGMLVQDGFSGHISDESNIIQLFNTATRITEQHWRITQKLRFLIPIGWIYFGIRYFLRSLSGKRQKLHYFKTAAIANERKKLYRQYGMNKQ